MEAPINEIPWQATLYSLSLNCRDKLVAASKQPGKLQETSLMDITKEATYTMYAILFFILLAIFGSLITIYEFIFEKNKRKPRATDYKKEEKKRETNLEKGKKLFKSHDFLEECKCFFKNFCLVTNGRKLLSTASTENQFLCLEGLRFFSATWNMFVHIGTLYFCILKDAQQAKHVFELTASQLLLNGFFGVDIFFVISGFLNSYLFYHKYSRSNGHISWWFFYFKRFLRLTPVYMIVLAFYSNLFTYTGSGIIWPNYSTNPFCERDWWWYPLYINNFEKLSDQCLLLFWYLAVDMQFHIISPLFMLSLIRYPRFGYFLIFASIYGSCATSFIITYQFSLSDGLSRVYFHLEDYRHFLIKFWEYIEFIYMKPHTRISPYLVGLTLGYFMSRRNIRFNPVNNSKVTLSCGWITSAIFIWISLFSFHKREEVPLICIALYNGTKFLLFSCAVAWIIYVCLTGQSKFLNNCLACKVFLPLGRLSYCIYLTHTIVMFRMWKQVENAVEFSILSLMLRFLYLFVISYPISFIASILFEVPMLNILDSLRKKIERKTLNLDQSSELKHAIGFNRYKIS